jgi:hypothetical protein
VGFRQSLLCTPGPSKCGRSIGPNDISIGDPTFQIVGEEMHNVRARWPGHIQRSTTSQKSFVALEPLPGDRQNLGGLQRLMNPHFTLSYASTASQ